MAKIIFDLANFQQGQLCPIVAKRIGQKNVCECRSKAGRKGTLGSLLHYFPKFYNTICLFAGLTTLGTFIYF